MIELFDMEAQDVSGVFLIEEECFSEPWSYSAFLQELENPNAVTVIAIESKEVIGFINARFLLGEGSINNIAVTRRARGKGTGSQLLKAVIDRARQKGIIKLDLEVRQSNAAALALYSKHGFVEVGKRKGFYSKPTEDAILMTLTL